MSLHIPVLLSEVVEIIKINSGGTYLDATFGDGGHSNALIHFGAQSVVGLDRDSETLNSYESSGKFRNDARLRLVHGRISQIDSLLPGQTFDGILVDLGMSTRQLLDTNRGFSFSKTGPLDMRMDRTETKTLGNLLKRTSCSSLAQHLRVADVGSARHTASRILKAIRQNPHLSTTDLAELAGERRGKRHPATKMFLALRMVVNSELTEIEKGIPILIEKLRPSKRLVVITYHSTEDRLIKTIFRNCLDKVKLVYKKPLLPSATEIRLNPKARSAKLRCVERI